MAKHSTKKDSDEAKRETQRRRMARRYKSAGVIL